MSKELKKWMPMFWGEYFAKTRHLTCFEHGAYLQLIGSYWLKGHLPDDDKQLARICGISNSHWRRIRPTLVRFFEPRWKHERIDQELRYAIEKSKTLSANAKLRYSIARASADTPTPTPTPIKKEDSKPPRVARGAHLIPEEWKPNEKHTQLASQLGLSMEQMENASCEMRDWSRGAGKRRTDWDATFNNWMRRNAQKTYKPNGKHEPPPRKYKTYRPPGWTDDDERRMDEEAARYAAGGESLLDQGAPILGKDRH